MAWRISTELEDTSSTNVHIDGKHTAPGLDHKQHPVAWSILIISGDLIV
jgi:hypothetical protein